LPIFSTPVHARNSASVLRKRFTSILCSPILPLKVLHFRVEIAVYMGGTLILGLDLTYAGFSA
jgi:hypothetical protein